MLRTPVDDKLRNRCCVQLAEDVPAVPAFPELLSRQVRPRSQSLSMAAVCLMVTVASQANR